MNGRQAVKIEISHKNYKRLLEAQDQIDLRTTDETLDVLLDFWLDWVNRAAANEQNQTYNSISR